MRTIGVFIIALLLLPSFPLQKAMENENNFFVGQGNAFHIPVTTRPSLLTKTRKKADMDTNELKQSGWYSNAIKQIEESEYEIKPVDKSNEFASPNRRQNLRAFYSADKFTLEPRAGDNWKLELTLKGVYSGKKKIYLPQQDPIAVTEKNKIQFNHNNEFTVEYVNSKEGVRQNFIIEKKPAGNPSALSIKLQANSGWFINKVHSKEIYFAKTNANSVEKKLTYNDLKAWDAGNKELAASFSTSKNEISISVNIVGAVYPIIIDPISTTPAAIVESNQATAIFGNSVAGAGDVNGDGYSDVIVGAYRFDNGETEEGVAFVYHGSATGISTIAATMVESNQVNAGLGRSVATAGDVNGDGFSDVIVGAQQYNNGQINEGGAFVYHGSASGINTSATSILESNQVNGNMGRSVASAGDVNGDGYSDVIVGAWFYDNGEAHEGAAFVYHGSASGISTTYTSMLESNQADAFLGYSVAPAGDVNGDGYSDVIVGAYAYDNGQTDEGAAFVYHGSAGGINPTYTSILESNQASAYLGYSVASAADVNGDGYSDVIVGAYSYDNGQTDEGVAFVYNGSATGIIMTPSATLESNQSGAWMAWAVASAGDVNGDGYSDVIVGAYLYDNGESNEGGAFIHYGSSTGVITIAAAFVESNQVNAVMGVSVSSAGDVNGDGYSDVIVGANQYDNGQIDEGAAFVYHGSPDGLNTTAGWSTESNQTMANYGFSVASAGDVNADGYSDVIVGAPYFDNGQMNEGAAFIFLGSISGLTATIQVQLERDQAGALMGLSVASAGDVNGDGYSDVIVGAYLFDNGETNEGVVFIYPGSPAGITNMVQTQLECDQDAASFGFSVAGAGDVNGDGYGDVIVGAPSFDHDQPDEGAAFVYHGSAAGITTTIQTKLECNLTNSSMGISVAGAGDVNGDGYCDVIVGASTFTSGQSEEGAAFVYHGSPSGITTVVRAQLESNQADAWMGVSVAGAGDVNGDGYGDVIVGAYLYDHPDPNEGVAFVYQGSPTGISLTPQTLLESNQADAYFGFAVSGAGDVNGDGYSDIVTGAFNYTNGQSGEGVAFIYYGSVIGVTTTIQAQLECNQAGAVMGYSVACAGDVNADGYSDVICGAINYDHPQSNEGTAFVYLGNKGSGNRNNLRLYNSDLVTPIQQSNMTDPNLFGAGLYAKSFIGRQKGKLVWETVRNGNPFSGSPISNSTAYTSQQAFFSDLGLTGFELKNQVAKMIPTKATYIRTRVKYDLATAITGQVYGPWRYPEGFLRGRRDIGAVILPVKFISFIAVKQDRSALLKWITADEEPGVQFEVQHSTDGINFTSLASINGRNQTQNEYQWLHNAPAKGNNFYRIRAVENQKQAYTATRKLNFSEVADISIYPNPAIDNQTLTIITAAIQTGQPVKISFISSAGQILWAKEITAVLDGKATLEVPDIPSGAYLLLVQAGKWTGSKKMIVAGR